jgi:hypothetical protein
MRGFLAGGVLLLKSNQEYVLTFNILAQILLPPFNYARPILKSKKSIYARPICVFAFGKTKLTLWHPCKA